MPVKIKWKLMAVWIVVFTILTILAHFEINRQVDELRDTKVDIEQLQSTNCSLKRFLLNSKNTRLRLAETTRNEAQRRSHIQAARILGELANGIVGVGEKCDLSGNTNPQAR